MSPNMTPKWLHGMFCLSWCVCQVRFDSAPVMHPVTWHASQPLVTDSRRFFLIKAFEMSFCREWPVLFCFSFPSVYSELCSHSLILQGCNDELCFYHAEVYSSWLSVCAASSGWNHSSVQHALLTWILSGRSHSFCQFLGSSAFWSSDSSYWCCSVTTWLNLHLNIHLDPRVIAGPPLQHLWVCPSGVRSSLLLLLFVYSCHTD